MRTRYIARAIVFGGLGLGWSAFVTDASVLAAPTALHADNPQDAQRPCPVVSDNCSNPAPTSTSDGYVYAFDVQTQTWIPVPLISAGSPDPKATYSYAVSPDCPQARTNPFDAVDCAPASQYCAANNQSGMHELVWRSEIRPEFRDWAVVGDICTGGSPDPIPTQQIIDAAEEYERTHLPPALPQMQPSNMAIVNMPLLVNVVPLPVQTMAVQLPVPGELVATPSYSWTFDDGTTVQGAGVPFDGTDPRVDPGHYVSHTYLKAHAHASVSLTVTWTAKFTAAGQTIDLPDVTMPAVTLNYSVHEARSVLVSG